MTTNIDIEKTQLASMKSDRSRIVDAPASYQDTKGFIVNLEKHKNHEMHRLHVYSYAALLHSRPHHLGGHGDCTLLTRLFNALGKQYRKEYFKRWVIEHSPLQFKGEQFVYKTLYDTVEINGSIVNGAKRKQTWGDWKHKEAYLTPWFQPNEQKLGPQPVFFDKACVDIEKMIDTKIKLIMAGPEKINCQGEIDKAEQLINEMRKFKDAVLKIQHDYEIAIKQKDGLVEV